MYIYVWPPSMYALLHIWYMYMHMGAANVCTYICMYVYVHMYKKACTPCTYICSYTCIYMYTKVEDTNTYCWESICMYMCMVHVCYPWGYGVVHAYVPLLLNIACTTPYYHDMWHWLDYDKWLEQLKSNSSTCPLVLWQCHQGSPEHIIHMHICHMYICMEGLAPPAMLTTVQLLWTPAAMGGELSSSSGLLVFNMITTYGLILTSTEHSMYTLHDYYCACHIHNMYMYIYMYIVYCM